MTNEEIIHLGHYAEHLMRADEWSALVGIYEAKTVETILSTAPGETDKREQAFADYAGLRSFLGTLKAIIQDKDALIAAEQAPSEDEPEIFTD